MNSYVGVRSHVPTLVVPPKKTATKRQAAITQAAECIDCLSAFATDEDSLDAVDVPQLAEFTSSPKDTVVFYVAGFVVRHCKKVLSCQICIAGLCGEPTTLPTATLVNVKLRGTLQWPSDALFVSLRAAEDYIADHLEKGSDPESFSDLLEQTLPVFLPLRNKLCESHASSVCAEVVIYYIVTRLHWHAKQVNKAAKSATVTKQHRKKPNCAN